MVRRRTHWNCTRIVVFVGSFQDFFCLFREVEYFEEHCSIEQVLEFVAKQVKMNNPPKSTTFLWCKRHWKLSVHCPCFLRLWLIMKCESNNMRQNTEFFIYFFKYNFCGPSPSRKSCSKQTLILKNKHVRGLNVLVYIKEQDRKNWRLLTEQKELNA